MTEVDGAENPKHGEEEELQRTIRPQEVNRDTTALLLWVLRLEDVMVTFCLESEICEVIGRATTCRSTPYLQ